MTLYRPLMLIGDEIPMSRPAVAEALKRFIEENMADGRKSMFPNRITVPVWVLEQWAKQPDADLNWCGLKTPVLENLPCQFFGAELCASAQIFRIEHIATSPNYMMAPIAEDPAVLKIAHDKVWEELEAVGEV